MRGAGLRDVGWLSADYATCWVMAYADAHLFRELDERARKLAEYGQYMLAEPEAWTGRLFGEGGG